MCGTGPNGGSDADHCQKTIVAPKGQQILVTFKQLELSNSYSCLEFYEGAVRNAPYNQLAEFCGTVLCSLSSPTQPCTVDLPISAH